MANSGFDKVRDMRGDNDIDVGDGVAGCVAWGDDVGVVGISLLLPPLFKSGFTITSTIINNMTVVANIAVPYLP